MSESEDGTFVTPEWLAEHLDDPGVVVVEASFYLPDEGKDADALFRDGHVPGAVRFDVDEIADHSTELPHMLPDAASFARTVGSLGIGSEDTIVVYDATDLLGGARAWWMFQHYGAANVRLLDGGWRAWLASGLPVERGVHGREPRDFAAKDGGPRCIDVAGVRAAVEGGGAQIVDARAAARFAGTVPEPRPGLRAGHIPGARNLPWKTLVDTSGRLRPKGEIAEAFALAGIDIESPIIASCGSGVSAAILLLGLDGLGRSNGELYDGSWAEWGGRHDLPAATGPAD